MKDLDVRIELIQALIPLGLEAVEEELQKEVSRLIGEKNSRKGSQIPYRRWGRQPGSACLSDKKVPIDVSRVRDSDPELPQEIRQHPELVRLFDNVENLRAMSDTASERLISIVDSLRKFARLDMAEMDEVDIHEGLETTLTLAQHEFQNRVEIIRDYGQLPSITCHPNQRWL